MTHCSPLTDELTQIYLRQWNIDRAANGDEEDHLRRELETILAVGELIYQNIRYRHLAWYSEVQAKRIPYDIEDAQAFADQYQKWKDATEHWLAQVDWIEQKKCCELNHASEIRTYQQELKLVDLDVRGLMRRWEELENGKGIEAGEFFASLRKRASA